MNKKTVLLLSAGLLFSIFIFTKLIMVLVNSGFMIVKMTNLSKSESCSLVAIQTCVHEKRNFTIKLGIIKPQETRKWKIVLNQECASSVSMKLKMRNKVKLMKPITLTEPGGSERVTIVLDKTGKLTYKGEAWLGFAIGPSSMNYCEEDKCYLW